MKNITLMVIVLFIYSGAYSQMTLAQYDALHGTTGQKAPLKDLIKQDKSTATYNETAKWISDKMTIYGLHEYNENNDLGSSYHYSNNYLVSLNKVTVDASALNIRQTIAESNYSKQFGDSRHPNGESSKSEYTVDITIPLTNLKRVSYTYNTLEFETFDNTISRHIEGQGTTYSNKYVQHMTFDKEDDINERLIKAFVHLTKFHWKKVGHEAF